AANGIFTTTFTIVTNGGTKTVSLKGYANYIAESFEAVSFPPDGWTSQDVDGDTYNWMQYATAGTAHTGANSAASASYVNDTKSAQQSHSSSSRGTLTPNNWLITPRLTISTGDELSYWIAAQDPLWPAENYSVKLSTTNNQIASFTNTLFTETLTSGDWQNHVLPLNTYAGESVYIAFQHHACTDQFVLKLDDVLMPPFAAPLVFGNISGIVYKYGTFTPIVGATVSVAGRSIATDALGAYTISNIVSDVYPLTASATGYIIYSEDVTIPVNSTLNKNIFLSYAEVYTANTSFNTDITLGASTALNVQLTNNGNATLEFETASGMWGGTIFPTTALNKTFEDDDITGWSGSVGENSAIYGNTTNSYGYLSDKTWVFNSNGTTAVQYLISPKLRVVTGDNLAFWYKQFNPSSESFEVRISTTDTGIASFTTTLATIGPLANQDWTNYSASLETYAGSDIYVMFYYPRTDGYELGYVMIDDITGPMMVAAPTDWLSCTPVGFPDLETLAPSASRMLTLSLDATTLPVGTYTAETWMFSNGLVSPYKLYVTLNVTQPVAPDAPVVSGIETNSGGITIAWDEVDNAVRYHVSGSDNPYTGYTPIETVTTEYIEITDAEIASFGLTARGFFKVTADSESSRSNKTALNVRSKSSSPLLPNFKRMQKTRTLKALQ
ncbi:MAG: choice-of-anchor J domain-containing protein, partial [Candidatus Cloacimonetes bacterium]|nr:choice-of-anchor J domain-containing protein [Candidatus Cloacimonadota bacterium]